MNGFVGEDGYLGGVEIIVCLNGRKMFGSGEEEFIDSASLNKKSSYLANFKTSTIVFG